MFEYFGSREDSDGYAEEAKRVVDLVGQAFGERLPLYSPVTTTPSGSDQVGIECDFVGLRWQEVSVDLVERHKDDLGFLTDEAFALYLPAYIVASIVEPESADVAWLSTLEMLTPRPQRRVARLGIFSSEERQALKEFVMFCSDWYPEMVSGVLVEFWGGSAVFEERVRDRAPIELPASEL